MRTWKRLLSFVLVFAILFSFPAPVFADRVSDIRQELSSISNELTQIGQELSFISERAGQLSQEVSQLVAMISVPGADLQSISRRLSEIQTEANQLSARKIILDERKSYLASRINALQQEIDALTKTTIPPPVIAPPPVSPLPQTNVSGEITNTIFPTTVVSGNPAAFRMDFKNGGNVDWTFVAAMTIRYPDGHDVDYGRIPSYVAAGSNGASTWSLSLPPGNYRVIFGLWRDEQTALTRSYWMDFAVTAPPVISPPPVAPPVVNPPAVVPPPSRNPMITGTSVPSVVTVENGFVFEMSFTDIPSDGSYEATATIRKAGGRNEDWERISLHETAGAVRWYRIFHVTGDFEIIFGIWSGETLIGRTKWIPFKSLTEEQVFNPLIGGDSNDMDGTGMYESPTPIPVNEVASQFDDADDTILAVESWEEIQEKSYQIPFTNRYVYLSPKTHFLFDHQPAVSSNEVLITRKTDGLMVSASGVDYYPIDLISSLGGTVRYEGNFIAVRLGENEALLDLDNQTVIANGDSYPIDPIWHHGDIAITADSVNLPTGFYLGFFGIHPARMSIYQEDTAYAEEFGNAHDKGPALIRDWVIGSVSGYFVGKAATILVSRAVSTIATRIVVSGISRETAVIATVEAERMAVSGMMKAVLSRLPKATSYEISLATERRLLARAAKVTGEKAERGILGEVNLVRAFRKLGVEIHPDFNHLYHGFDNVGRVGERIVIGEAKYVSKAGQFTLSDLPETGFGRQMGSRWIDRASGLLENAGKAGLSRDIMSQLRAGSLRKVLVITRPSGKAYGVSDGILTLFDEVLEVDLSGAEIARYVR